MLLAVLAFHLLTAWTGAQTVPRGPGVKPLRMGRADSHTFVGLVSDSSCSAKHRMDDKTAAECARACARDGAGYILVAGEKTYPLAGHDHELDVLAGQKVKVTGSLENGSIRVSQVSPAR